MTTEDLEYVCAVLREEIEGQEWFIRLVPDATRAKAKLRRLQEALRRMEEPNES